VSDAVEVEESLGDGRVGLAVALEGGRARHAVAVVGECLAGASVVVFWFWGEALGVDGCEGVHRRSGGCGAETAVVVVLVMVLGVVTVLGSSEEVEEDKDYGGEDEDAGDRSAYDACDGATGMGG
jgi:hypothetical protein